MFDSPYSGIRMKRNAAGITSNFLVLNKFDTTYIQGFSRTQYWRLNLYCDNFKTPLWPLIREIWQSHGCMHSYSRIRDRPIEYTVCFTTPLLEPIYAIFYLRISPLGIQQHKWDECTHQHNNTSHIKSRRIGVRWVSHEA